MGLWSIGFLLHTGAEEKANLDFPNLGISFFALPRISQQHSTASFSFV